MMKRVTLTRLWVGIATFAVATALSHGVRADLQLIFDNYDAETGVAFDRNASEGIGSHIQIKETTTINRIGVLNQLTSAMQLQFMVFRHNDPQNHELLYNSGWGAALPEDTQLTWKESPEFSLTLTPGFYDIGAIAGGTAFWAVDTVSHVENGIVSVVDMPDFDGTSVIHNGIAYDGALRLYAVPEPATILLWIGTALLGLVMARRRRE